MYSNKLICNILTFIHDNINFKISVDELEKIFLYSRYYIMKLFKKEVNLTLIDYINSIRIYNCISDMRYTENNVLSIALKHGFYSIEYFSETFKKIVGVCPRTAVNYFRRKKNISIEDIDKINSSLVELYSISLFKDKYLLNQKPIRNMVKKLSIFK